MYKGFAISREGFSHKANGTQCQDASRFEANAQYAIAAVSDGHGGEKYFRSGTGAKVAVEIAHNCLKEFCEKLPELPGKKNEWDRRINDLKQSIIAKWRSGVEKDFAENTSLTVEEQEICNRHGIKDNEFNVNFYGATLLIACLTAEYAFAAQLGDGACVFLQSDKAATPVPLDERLGFGLTTSLCDKDAANSFRHYVSLNEELPEGIFLSTDGVTDSYGPENFLAFNQKIFHEMKKDAALAESQLQDWLLNLSEQGSRDDVSVAGIYSCGNKRKAESKADSNIALWPLSHQHE